MTASMGIVELLGMDIVVLGMTMPLVKGCQVLLGMGMGMMGLEMGPVLGMVSLMVP